MKQSHFVMCTVVLGLLGAFIQCASADEIDNPFRNAAVGDWAKFEHRAPPLEPFFTKVSVVEKNDEQVVLEYELGEGAEKLRETIQLSKPLAASHVFGFIGRDGPTIATLGSEVQQLNVNGKHYETRKVSYVLSPNTDRAEESHAWFGNGLPLAGISKTLVLRRDGRERTVTLIDFGFADPSKNGPAPDSAPRTVQETQEVKDSIGITLIYIESGECDIGEMEMLAFRQTVSEAVFKQDGDRMLDLVHITPQKRHVLIEDDYYLAATEVTIGQFRRFVEATGYQTTVESSGVGGSGLLDDGSFGVRPHFNWSCYGFNVTEDTPVGNVSWKDAQAFCKWLSTKEGVTYRLPTEAEWEYACRASGQTTFHSGADVASVRGHANLADAALQAVYPGLKWGLEWNDGYPYLAPVGQFKPNAWGLHDMHGNLAEWCQDDFDVTQGALSFAADLRELGLRNTNGQKTFKGGSWFKQPVHAGCACRIGAPSDFGNSLIGFRVARDVERE